MPPGVPLTPAHRRPIEAQRRPTEAELLASSGRDPAAFRALYELHAAGLHRFFLSRTGHADDALDLTAETFAQAWLGRDRFEDRLDGRVGPWLYGIARNLLRRSVRDRRIEDTGRQRLGLLDGADRAPHAAEPEWLDGMDADLEAALTALPRGQRRAISLRVLDDLPYDEVGDRLGCSPLAARIRVSRGLSAVRTHIEEEDTDG